MMGPNTAMVARGNRASAVAGCSSLSKCSIPSEPTASTTKSRVWGLSRKNFRWKPSGPRLNTSSA
ncbi:hypothetical protein ACN28S_43250 [Cystobacter fuscus]